MRDTAVSRGQPRNFNVGQPAVSQHVAGLERSLGTPLVYRAGRGVRLTEAGQLAVDYGERILRLTEQLHAGVDGLKGLVRGRLVVGAGQTPGDYMLPRVLGEFRRRHPGVAVELEIAGTARVVEWLLRHVYDLGFLGDVVEHKDLEVTPFVEDRVVLFVRADDPLAHIGPVDLDAVLAMGLIVREPGSATRATGERAMRAAGADPVPAMELGSNESVKQATLAGLGAGMLSSLAIELERVAGRLAVLDVPAFDGRRMLYVARHRTKPLSHAEQAFLNLASEMLSAHCGSPSDQLSDPTLSFDRAVPRQPATMRARLAE